MPRKSLIRDAFFPYHVTNRTLGQRHYPLCMDQLWQLYSDQLCQAAWAYNANIHAFVLMSNHYHLLLSTPSLNIDEIIQAFQSQISLEISKRLNSKDWCFDTRYRWTLLKNRSYFYNTYRYVYQNPLRAGLAKEVSEYKYSTFHGRAGYSKLSIPLWAHPLQDDMVWKTLTMKNFG